MSDFKRLMVLFVLLLALLVACNPATTEPGAGQQPAAETPQVGNTSDAAVAAAITFLANELGLPESDIALVSVEATEFSDSCFGLGGAAEICLQAITPGYVVGLSTDGQEYEVRTDAAGTSARLAGDDTSNDAIAASAAAVLADELGVSPDEIEVVSVEATEFTDGCLGLGGPDEICLQAITPGYIVTLSASGQEYVAHTDANGVQVRLANTMP